MFVNKNATVALLFKFQDTFKALKKYYWKMKMF
jgi:hypothetical protein